MQLIKLIAEVSKFVVPEAKLGVKQNRPVHYSTTNPQLLYIEKFFFAARKEEKCS
jgi:hypothetical protein